MNKELIKNLIKNQNFPNKWRITENEIEIKIFKRNFKRICRICNRDFIAGGNSNWCGCCSLEFKCNHCNEWIEFPIYKLHKLDLNHEYGCLEYCYSLGAKNKMAPGKCCSCGKEVKHRDQFTFGYECGCHEKAYFKHNNSESMKKIEIQNGLLYGPKNIIKYNKSEQGRNKSSEIIRKVNKLGLNNFVGSEEQKIHLENLNTKMHIFDQNIDCSNKCVLFSNCKNKNKNILKNEFGFCSKYVNSLPIRPNFIIKDNIVYYYDKSINDYIPWEDYKTKFKTFNIDFKLPERFKLYTTFRTQESEDWSGARGAFEQNLVENDVNWFVYIKFDENNKPLVVGKSGSLLVNSNGSDLSFSMNANDGPARRYLIENNLDWNKTHIAIMNCDSEQEALKLEKEIALKYNLFES